MYGSDGLIPYPTLKLDFNSAFDRLSKYHRSQLKDRKANEQ